MDTILSDIKLIERKSLSSFLIKNHASNDIFQLWRSFLKPVMLNGDLEKFERRLYNSDKIISPIRCRLCGFRLKWIDFDEFDAEEAYLCCTRCSGAKPLLKLNGDEAASILIDLLDKEHPQIIAPALKLTLISGNILNAVSPPEIPDNPFKTFKILCEKSPNTLRYGGSHAVIMADIYINTDIDPYPILYIADTISIPTRYFLYALKFKSETFNPSTGQSTEHNPDIVIPKYQEDYLIKELSNIANNFIQPGSFLLLGKHLQYYISSEYYLQRRNHNLSIIVPFNSLCPLDKNRKRRFDVTHNFEQIVEPAIQLCEIVKSIFNPGSRTFTDDLANYERLQKYLNVIIWLAVFSETPFETMIYHIIQNHDQNMESILSLASSSSPSPSPSPSSSSSSS